uniref:Dual specificity tyrosine-phosphorylation-regulated kinase 4-like n=1 Tax=Petromyzon marinus TaxID=7757 RepID=A0AAJ7XJY2_PETMA|nr:dual specificity tyrosine-phosphorylation-regulated kinase 4-like [Petromyzon marinus]
MVLHCGQGRQTPGAASNDSYDDENNNYIPVRKEQLNYRYEVQKMIGEGGQGLVLQCRDHKTKTLVAVKMLSLPLCSSTAARQRTELEVAKKLQGRASDERYGVIRVLDTFEFRGHNCLVVELLKKSLYDVMSKGSIRRIYVRRLREYTRAILNFLLYAKGRGIIHGDIKPVSGAGAVVAPSRRGARLAGAEAARPLLIAGSNAVAPVHLEGGGGSGGGGVTLPPVKTIWDEVDTQMATGKDLFDSRIFIEHLPYCIEILGMPPKKMVDEAPNKTTYFDPEGLPYNLSKQVPPGSLPLHRALQGHHPQLVDFMGSESPDDA